MMRTALLMRWSLLRFVCEVGFGGFAGTVMANSYGERRPRLGISGGLERDDTGGRIVVRRAEGTRDIGMRPSYTIYSRLTKSRCDASGLRWMMN